MPIATLNVPAGRTSDPIATLFISPAPPLPTLSPFIVISLPNVIPPLAEIPELKLCKALNVCAAFVNATFVIAPVFPLMDETP